MTTATHTPGPWTNGGSDWLVSQKHGTGWRYMTIRGSEHDVATVWCDEDDAEQDANVSLVMAAPELLAACKAMARACDYGDGDSEFAALEAIKAAVAKAEAHATVRHRVSVTVEVGVDTPAGEALSPENIIRAAVEIVRDGEGQIVAHEIVK